MTLPGYDDWKLMTPEEDRDRLDWFAGQALAGIMANPERWKQIAEDYKTGRKTYEQCSAANAAKAFSIGRAMMRERVICRPEPKNPDDELDPDRLREDRDERLSLEGD